MGKVLSFFLAKGGVGKSTVSFHTAVALSRMGFRVIYVDASNTISPAYFIGLDNHKGLKEYYFNNAEITSLVYQTKLRNLSIVPGGAAFRKSAIDLSLLGSTKNKTKQLLWYLKVNFDYVVIDNSTPASSITLDIIEDADGVVFPCLATSFTHKEDQTTFALFNLYNLYNIKAIGFVISNTAPDIKAKMLLPVIKYQQSIKLPILKFIDYSSFLETYDINTETGKLGHPYAKYTKQYKELAEIIIEKLSKMV